MIRRLWPSLALLVGMLLMGGLAHAGPTDHLLQALPPQDRNLLLTASPLVGVVLLVVSLVPLFLGWVFLRATLALIGGCFLALWTWGHGLHWITAMAPSAQASTQMMLLYLGTALAFVVGAVVGYFIYQLELGITGAALGALLFGEIGAWVGSSVVAWACAAVGFVLGFIAGVVIAPYWAALQTSLLGGVLVAEGIVILAQPRGAEPTVQFMACGLGLGAAILGFVVQASGILRRHGGAAIAPSGAGAHRSA